MKQYFLVDIDGTVANLDHRVHWVQSKPKNWKAFNAGIPFDKPIEQVIDVVHRLSESGLSPVFCSGRSDDTFTETRKWIDTVAMMPWAPIYMRKAGDFRADDIVKEEILDKIIEELGCKPLFVFYGRPTVISMWRRRGVFVFDVDQGRW